MKRILDQFDVHEAAVPQLPGRLDRSRVVMAGHWMGGQPASLLLGTRLTDPDDGTKVNLAEPRIKTGVLLAALGRGGDALSEFAAKNYSFLSTMDFSEMTTPALVVAGDKDASAHLTVLGPEWHTDPCFLSPGPKSLLALFGAEHGLGGVGGQRGRTDQVKDSRRPSGRRSPALSGMRTAAVRRRTAAVQAGGTTTSSLSCPSSCPSCSS